MAECPGNLARRLTAAGPGALQVWEIRGAAVIEFLSDCLRGTNSDLPYFRPVRARLVDGAEPIDEVLVHRRPPGDQLEISLHGGEALSRRLAVLLRSRGFAIVEAESATGAAVWPGETRLDEEFARALREVRSRCGAIYFAELQDGRFESFLRQTAAIGDAGILAAEIDAWLGRAAWATALLEPPRLVLSGPVNAGKSSLFNRLCRRERVITGPEPGTTRDRIEVEIELRGHAFLLVDTAGLRSSEDPVEKMGIERSREAARLAQVRLQLEAPGEPGERSSEPPDPGGSALLRVQSFGDLLDEGTRRRLEFRGLTVVSSISGEGLDRLEGRIIRASVFGGAFAGRHPAPFTTRQVDRLREARSSLPADPDRARSLLLDVLS